MKAPKVLWAWVRVVFWTFIALVPAVIHDISGDISGWAEKKSRKAEERWDAAKRL